MEEKNIRCSVAVLTYNSERYLPEQLDSILSNISEEDEVVISDDGSTDSTLEIIQGYMTRDQRIRLVHNAQSHGVNGNYANAYANCRGEIIFHSDDDNVWLPGKVETVLRYYAENPKAFMVMHDAIIVDADLKQLHPSFYQWRNSKPGVLHNVIRLSYGGSMISFRRELLKRLLPMPKEMPVFFDAWVGFMADKHFESLFIPEKLSLWRRHADTASGGTFSTNPAPTNKKKVKLIGRVASRVKLLWFVMRH